MTNIIGVESLGDKLFEPHNIARSLFNNAAIVGPRGSVENMCIWGNGSINEVTIERGMPLIGKPVVPQALIFSRGMKGGDTMSDYDMVCKNLIEPTLNDIKTLYTDNFKLMTWTDKTHDQRKENYADMRIKTKPQVPRNQFIVYEERDYMHVEVDRTFLRKQDDILQNNISDRILDIRNIPRFKPIGIGIIHDGWKSMRRPNTIFKIGPRTTLKLEYIERKYARAEWVAMTSYAYITAAFVREWGGEDMIPGFEFEDWVALATVWIGFLAGYGTTDTNAKFTVEDVVKLLDHYPGLGWSEANRYMFGGDGTPESFEDIRTYYMFCKVLGLAASRVKALAIPMNLVKDLYVNEHSIPERIKEVFTPEMPAWGSDGSLFFPMARNNFAYNAKQDIGIPCLVDMEKEKEMTDGEKLDDKTANQYERLEPREMMSFAPVRVEKGEIPAGVVSEHETALKGLVFTASNDARIYETVITDGMNMRTILGLRLPLHNIVLNNMDRKERIKLWLYSLVGNNEIRMKNGYVMNVSLGTLSAVSVKYRRGSLDTMIVDVKDSAKPKGEEVVLKPAGNLVSGSVNISQDLTRTDVQPGQPRDYTPDRAKMVETVDGSKKEDSTVASPVTKKGGDKGGDNPKT